MLSGHKEGKKKQCDEDKSSDVCRSYFYIFIYTRATDGTVEKNENEITPKLAQDVYLLQLNRRGGMETALTR